MINIFHVRFLILIKNNTNSYKKEFNIVNNKEIIIIYK